MQQRMLSLRKNQRLEHIRSRFLVGGKYFQQVRHRDHALVALFVVENDEVVDTVLLHEAKAIFERGIWSCSDERTRHNFRHAHPGWAFIFRSDFVGYVALGYYALQHSMLVTDAYGANF